jgi:two-component system sensor histidine kinase KdpD
MFKFSPKFDFKPELLLEQRKLEPSLTWGIRLRNLFFTLLLITVTTFALYFLDATIYIANMSFMILTLVITVWLGLEAGLITAVISFFSFTYFFVPPTFSMEILAPPHWWGVILFLITVVLSNQIAGRARLTSQQAQARTNEITTLYDLITLVIEKVDQPEMLGIALKKVCETLALDLCILYLTSDTEKETITEFTRIELTPVKGQPDRDLAKEVFKNQEAAFISLENLQPNITFARYSRGSYLPLSSGAKTLGVLGLISQSNIKYVPAFSAGEKRLLQVFANHIALAVQHVKFVKETAQLAGLRESDKLKSAILASVSHELRTPITAIKSTNDTLLDKSLHLNIAERQQAASIIDLEVTRLGRLVSNLLDLTKIEAGVLKPHLDWYFLPEIVEVVVARLKNNGKLGNRFIQTVFSPDIVLTQLDYLQIDQVLTNLIENAANYSKAGQPISILVEMSVAEHSNSASAMLLVKVEDDGIGIPLSEIPKVFNKFYRFEKHRVEGTASSGTGIGLAISKGIVEAHKGKIWAERRIEGGMRFCFTIPITLQPTQFPPELEELVQES